MSAPDYPYRWFWKGHGTQRQRSDVQCKDQLCRVICAGKMNSVLIEFEGGYRVVTSRRGLRKAKADQ
jgi:hypothetical protein